MKGIEIKATLYDIFGYLLPGYIFIVSSAFIWTQIDGATNMNESIEVINNITKNYGFLLIGFSYYLGHVISTATKYVIHKKIVKNNKMLADYIDLKSIFRHEIIKSFNDKYMSLFGVRYDDKDFSILVSHLEKNNASLYSTAFVFLSIYGMARTISGIMLLFTVIELALMLIIQQWYLVIYVLIGLTTFICFFYEYMKFLKYFRSKIYEGFILDN